MTDITRSSIDQRGQWGVGLHLTVTHAGANQSSIAVTAATAAGDADLLHRVATQMFEIVPDFAPVFTRQLLRQVPDLGSVDDTAAVEATRRSALGSMYELLCITRAGLSDPSIIETSPEALEHVRFLRSRGVGMGTVLRFYHIGISMFEPLMAHAMARFVSDPAAMQRMAGPLRVFIFTYVDQITKRLAAELGGEREGWVSDPNDPIWHDPEAVGAVQAFIEQRASTERGEPTDGSAARAYAQVALTRFCHAMQAAAQNERLSRVLARANTSVRIELADEPELSTTLLLDRNPIEIVQTNEPAEVEISIVSVDLARLYSPDFHLAMAIARGRVGYSGPVRKFLRVTPVVRHASLPELLSTPTVMAVPG
jgi:hypothetical protein